MRGLYPFLLLAISPRLLFANEMVDLRVEIVDSETRNRLAARIYLRSEDGKWWFVDSENPRGSAVRYEKTRGVDSTEIHTTVSAHPVIAELPPGKYDLTIERGKEYLPHTQSIELRAEPKSLRVALDRWIDMAKRGWYSGETHVHRRMQDLPTAMLADDLNVALPLTYWVTRSHTPPARGDKNSPPVKPELIEVDRTHVIYPMNTEYEIFSVRGVRHTLGAVFALNHKTVFQHGVPPVQPIAKHVREEGGLLELDKHNWPWSMMLVPVMNVDLYELTNNHIWRTNFHYRDFGVQPPDYMRVERDERGITERGWIDYTLGNYYALLNCGFRMRPTAGTASGVHPVPLGFGRVYVYQPEGFSYDSWIRGLDQGHSFVTTGPMLDVRFNAQPAGTKFEDLKNVRITGWARGTRRLAKLEIIAAGRVARNIAPDNQPLPDGGFSTEIDEQLEIDGSTWLAVRCFESLAGGRVRFAHTAPTHFDITSAPLRPARREINFLMERVRAEIARNRGVLTDDEIVEFETALAKYREIANTARSD